MPSSRPFLVDQTHGILSRKENTIHASSDALGWHSLYASTQREVPYEGMFPAVDDQLIVLHIDGPVSIDSLYGPKRMRSFVPPGGIHLVPGGMDFGVRLMGTLDTMHVYLRQHIIEEVAREIFVGDSAMSTLRRSFSPPTRPSTR